MEVRKWGIEGAMVHFRSAKRRILGHLGPIENRSFWAFALDLMQNHSLCEQWLALDRLLCRQSLREDKGLAPDSLLSVSL
jgi:hypothetical protein